MPARSPFATDNSSAAWASVAASSLRSSANMTRARSSVASARTIGASVALVPLHGTPQLLLAQGWDVDRARAAAGHFTVTPSNARDLIADAGWAEAFEHGTGHGVGLDIHEAPAVGPGSTAILGADVVVTVEPGVYLAGIGGVRVEDTVVVTADGCHTLTRFPKDIAA